MAWTYILMWHGIPFEELEEPYATSVEQEALQAAQRLADQASRPVDVVRVQEGVAESGPYKTLYPRIVDG